jgi:hypothetical protein
VEGSLPGLSRRELMVPSRGAVHVFGIRHHGPGSARSLERALARVEPDVVLIEGPPEADPLIALASDEAMRPPVALLVYRPDVPRRAVYYPFAEYSPEWRAIQFAMGRRIPVRFIDLPQTHQLIDEADEPADEPADDQRATEPGAAPENGDEPNVPMPPDRPDDPLGWLAAAAGYDDGERFWEQLVEHRRHDDEALFASVGSVMAELRHESDARRRDTVGAHRDAFVERARQREERREAHMRRAVREAQKNGFHSIAVVCGAWHVPALTTMPSAAQDAATLKGLPKVKVDVTWVPWTNSRLCAASGYGAGIESPGWYQHLWQAPDRVTERWLARVAALLREEDLDASSAQIIDAARLADSLAALRGRSLAGLAELMEATRAVLLTGHEAPLALIARKLVVGETLGQVPAAAPTVPLHQDLMREQRRLRLQPEAVERSIDLDLRKENDLARSHLLHRLTVLGVPWGKIGRAAGQRGTFHELWSVQWHPEFAVSLIEAAVWGNTVSSAATARAADLARHAAGVPALTALLQQVVLADLGDSVGPIMSRLQEESARAPDIGHLMDGLPALAGVLRYSDVRRTDLSVLGGVVDGFVVRICVGLPVACGSLDDDAATEMRGRIETVQGAIALLERDEHTAAWHGAIRLLADSDRTHGTVAGRCTRLLFDGGVLDTAELTSRLSRALSAAEDPARAAAWVEGFLAGSGQLLLHDDVLWRLIDDWLAHLRDDTFVSLLPLLRRAFSEFTGPERRQLGQRARQPGVATGATVTEGRELDHGKAEAGLRTVLVLLGVDAESWRESDGA